MIVEIEELFEKNSEHYWFKKTGFWYLTYNRKTKCILDFLISEDIFANNHITIILKK